METFAECARKHFDFLIHEYQFTHGGKLDVLPELGKGPNRARYDGPHIFIWIYAEKDELDVSIFAKVHTSILRPYEQRFFSLHQILRATAPESLKNFPESISPLYSPPANFEEILKFYAVALRMHCDALLRMDLKLLEQTYQWSRGKT